MTYTVDRRRLIEVSALAAVAGAASAATAPPANAAAATAHYALNPMPFEPARVPGLSAKILQSHYENNYGGAVKRLNAIAAELASLDWGSAPNFVVNGLKREELIAMNSMILHEHYFSAFAGSEESPHDSLAGAIKRDFGSLERWRAEFAAMGKAQGGGSGWVILAYSPRDKRLINTWAADHTTTLAGGRPVLVLDMYEHAYHVDFGAKAGAYVDAFMAAARWDGPAALFDRYMKES